MNFFAKIPKRKGFHSIGTKIAIVISILIGFISLFIFIYMPEKLEEQAIKAISDKAKSIALITAVNIGPALFFDDIPNIKTAMKSAMQNKDLVYIIIINNSKGIVSSYNKNLAETVDYTQLDADNPISKDGKVYKVMSPVVIDNQEIGKLYIGISLNALRSGIASSRITIALVCSLVFLIGMLATFLVSSVLTRSLTKMVETANQISRGNMTRRVDIYSHDEIGHLAKAFNQMVDNLEAAYKELKSVNISLGRRVDEMNMFLTTISHDLKTPLVGIQVISGMLMENYSIKLDEPGKDYIKRIQNYTEFMGKLLDDLMELSRLERVPNKIETVNVYEVINLLINRNSQKFRERGTKVVIKNQIPLIRCDRQRINQVFDNLLDNANKFIGEGNTDPTVEIGYEIQDGYHKFHVKDNGIGIQKEYHEKVFQVFQRLDQKTGGTGVGLTITKKIIEGFEGKIWLDSDKGKGTTVYFTIPRDISAD